ncbi:MAG: DUF2993 domain-containing protein [Microbacterium sp.]|nr:DUF2993 domain-containing protein [Microbacterium sp.]
MSDDNPTLPYPAADSEHPTLALPRETDAVAGSPRRRRWPWVVLIVVVVLALLAVAGELLARSVLPGVVRSIVVEKLDLPADQQLDVDADGVLLPQLIGGTLDSLHLSSDSVTLQGVTGAVDVTATGVPLRGGDLGGVTGAVSIDQSQFADLLAGADLPIDSVTLEAPNATVAGTVPVLGVAVPLTLTVTPFIVDGDLDLTPESLTVGGVSLDADQVRATLGSLGERLTQPQRICLADRLPAGVTLTSVKISGTRAVVDVAVDGAILSDAALQEKGVCPRN